ncbi:Riboflavin synthase [compost metagenome]
MFTGIVEEIGTVVDFEASQNVLRIKVQASKVLEETYLGDSISTNGVCLTVTDIGKNYFYADVMGETVRRSNLGTLKKGDKVNLERAMAANSRFGGHIVSGHIDGKGKITSYEKEGNAVWITIDADREILKYVVEKGSIAIDGISLTLAYVDDRKFKVSIIPHTSEETTLLRFNKKNDEKKSITMDFLINNGF